MKNLGLSQVLNTQNPENNGSEVKSDENTPLAIQDESDGSDGSSRNLQKQSTSQLAHRERNISRSGSLKMTQVKKPKKFKLFKKNSIHIYSYRSIQILQENFPFILLIWREMFQKVETGNLNYALV